MKRPAIRIILKPLGRLRGSQHDESYGAPLQGLTEGRVVSVDPRVPQPHRVLLHELIHARHPSWPEHRVAATEEIRWARMSWKEKAELLRMFGRAKIGGDEE